MYTMCLPYLLKKYTEMSTFDYKNSLTFFAYIFLDTFFTILSKNILAANFKITLNPTFREFCLVCHCYYCL